MSRRLDAGIHACGREAGRRRDAAVDCLDSNACASGRVRHGAERSGRTSGAGSRSITMANCSHFLNSGQLRQSARFFPAARCAEQSKSPCARSTPAHEQRRRDRRSRRRGAAPQLFDDAAAETFAAASFADDERANFGDRRAQRRQLSTGHDRAPAIDARRRTGRCATSVRSADGAGDDPPADCAESNRGSFSHRRGRPRGGRAPFCGARWKQPFCSYRDTCQNFAERSVQ